jgi:2-oxoglutarate ferredoxin oxidoreductase subunit beta
MKTIVQAVEHKGMALVDVLQPCPTYNNLHNKEWFAETVEVRGAQAPRTFIIEDQGYNGTVSDPNNPDEIDEKKKQAFDMAHYRGAQVPLGVFYKVNLPTYYDRMTDTAPVLKEQTPANARIADASGRPATDLTKPCQSVLV